MTENLTPLSPEEYLSSFPEDKIEAAFTHACEIRKFEIELYWKRATYFWVFIGASFAGYFALVKSDDEYAKILISCIGLVFSVAWHCVNKGSKFWQENWENHVELLEDKVVGPLYKTLTSRPEDPKRNGVLLKTREFLTAPKDFSVSKINQIVSTYIAIIWALLLLQNLLPINGNLHFDIVKFVLVFITIFTLSSFWWAGKSHLQSHTPKAAFRKSEIYRQNGS